MKVRRIRAFWLLAVYVTAGLVGGASVLVAPAQASAGLAPSSAATQIAQQQAQQNAAASQTNQFYVFDYPTDPDLRNSMNDAVKASSPDLSNAALGMSAVYNHDAIWGSTGEFRKFSFDASDTADPQQTHMFAYTTSYFCSTKGVLDDKQPTSGKYALIDMVSLVHLDDGFYKDVTHKASAGIKHFTLFDTQNGNAVTVDNWDVNDIYKSGHINDIRSMQLATSCLPFGTLANTSGYNLFNIRNMHDPAVKTSWPGGWTLAKSSTANQKDASSPNGAQAPSDSGSGGSNAPDPCANAAIGFGWVLCPMIDFMAKTIGGLFKDIVMTSLETDALNQSQGWGAGIYNVWKNIRTVANASFVLIFLYFIFANLLGYELDTYAIKKIIPKLVAAAVLVQFSFVLCAVILDISNILGQGMGGLLAGVSATSTAGGHSVVNGNTFHVALGGLLDVITVVLAFKFLTEPTIIILVILGIVGLIGILTVVAVLIMRKIIIALLVVFSPLALVAMVLPNTEKLFKMWENNFIRVVLMYPMIAALFGLTSVLSSTLSTINSGTNISVLDAPHLVAAGFPIICFFLVPLTYKWAGGLMNFTSGYITNIGARARKGAVGKFKESDFHGALQKNREEKRLMARERKLTDPEAVWSGGGVRGKRKAASRWWTRTKATGDFMTGTPLERLQTAEGKDAAKRRHIQHDLETAQHAVAMDTQLMEKSAEQQKRQLKIKAIQDMYAGSSVSKLAKAIEDAGTAADRMSREEAQLKAIALGQMISRNGAMDQGGHMDAIFKKFATPDGTVADADKEALKNAINEVRDVNFGHILNGAPVLSSFNVDNGDHFDEAGNVVASYKLAKSLSEKSGDKLMGQTGTGWEVVANMQLDEGAMDEFLADESIAADVRERVRAKRAAGQTVTGADLISQAVRDQVQEVGVLKGKLGGVSEEIMGPLPPVGASTVPRSGAAEATLGRGDEADHGSLDDMGTAS